MLYSQRADQGKDKFGLRIIRLLTFALIITTLTTTDMLINIATRTDVIIKESRIAKIIQAKFFLLSSRRRELKSFGQFYVRREGSPAPTNLIVTPGVSSGNEFLCNTTP
jgi:hypothetical protein